MNELVCICKVINFFGIKGELKILSDFDKKELAFKIGMPIMIKEENLEIKYPCIMVKSFYKNRTLCIEIHEVDVKSHNCIVNKTYYIPTIMRNTKL